MPIDIQRNNGLLIPSKDMVFGLELKKLSSKRHSSSKTSKESSVFPQSNRSPKDADKSNSKNGIGPQRGDPKQKAKQVTEGSIRNYETVKRSATESDELVRHMSNLPGYLLHTDGVENVQEKAFNVGVLDWSQLEKWKHKHIPALASHFTSSNRSESSSRSATKSYTSVGVREKLDDKTGLHSSGRRSASKESVPESTNPSFKNVKQFESPKSGSKSIRDEPQMTALALESYGKTHTNESLERKSRSRRTTGNDYIERTSHVGTVASKSRRHRDDGIEQKMEGLQEYSHKKKERSRKFSSDLGQTSVKSKYNDASFGSEKTSSGSSETRKKVEQLQESDFDNNLKHGHSKRRNIVLLYPHEIPHSSSDDFRLSEFRTSSDENFPESSRSSLSYVSIPEEVYTEYGGSGIPLSGALHSAADHTSCSETIQDSISTDLGKDHSSLASEKPGLKSGASIFERDLLDTRLRNQCAFAIMKESLDQETAELTAQKGMNPSHNRRFSFSLSRISRSFSFKEGPTVPPVSSRFVSAMSGPVTPESSVRWDNSSKEKANIKNKTRSSPLRRLLDPILKNKASSDTRHSAKSGQTQKGSTSSIGFRSIGVNESLQVERSKGTLIQGLLQLTIINGVPLFKFVLNNERKIYAATRNGLALQEKDDLGCCLTFYLVNEIKKKSGGWMSHGNKEKSCGYAYNIVAQMKFSSSNITEPISPNSKRQRMVKEYVLLGADIGQTDQGPPKFIQHRELAAVVIGTPCENLSKEGLHSNDNFQKKECLKCFAEERCLCSSRENDISGSTTVILPGGVHGSPNRGEPSPLIHRWKTGGSCDCGGWDIGCKLRVLCEPKQSSNVPRSYKTRHDRFQLFVQVCITLKFYLIA